MKKTLSLINDSWRSVEMVTQNDMNNVMMEIMIMMMNVATIVLGMIVIIRLRHVSSSTMEIFPYKNEKRCHSDGHSKSIKKH